MTNREFFVQRWQMEDPITRKVLRALPESKIDHRPHDRSNSAGKIAWILAQELDGLAEILETGETDWTSKPEPRSRAEIIAAYERGADRLNRALAGTDEAKWLSRGRFLSGGHVVFEAPRQEHSWWILFDQVHHRGQLTTYIRPMGGRVPAVYGPSGDEVPTG